MSDWSTFIICILCLYSGWLGHIIYIEDLMPKSKKEK